MSSQRSRKVWKLLLGGGLVIILLAAARTKGFTKNKFNPINQLLISRSRYSALLPYIVAQGKLETADPKPFESHVYQVDNNLFGMKVPERRPWVPGATVGIKAPDGGHYSHYKSDTDSIRDLILWFDFTRFPVSVNSAADYAHELKKRSYYEVPEAQYLKLLNLYL